MPQTHGIQDQQPRHIAGPTLAKVGWKTRIYDNKYMIDLQAENAHRAAM